MVNWPLQNAQPATRTPGVVLPIMSTPKRGAAAGRYAPSLEATVQSRYWPPGSQCGRLKNLKAGLHVAVRSALGKKTKLSVAHGVMPRVDPTGAAHIWRSPCAIEGETPWPPCKSGSSRRHHLFLTAGRLGTAPAALTLRVGTLSLFSPCWLAPRARSARPVRKGRSLGVCTFRWPRHGSTRRRHQGSSRPSW